MDYVETLLIIGNGFDLNLNVKSRFSDFFDKTCNNLLQKLYKYFQEYEYSSAIDLYDKNNEDINIWSFMMYIQRYCKNSDFRINQNDYNNWSDIESIISKSLLDKSILRSNIEYYVNEARIYFDQPKKFGEFQESHMVLNPYIFFALLSDDRKHTTYKYLLIELNKFENSFKKYLTKILPEDYNDKSMLLLNKIIDNESNHIDILNFNYTSVANAPCINKQINVHGRLIDDEIIIGIDSNGIVDTQLYRFTKTYRNLHREKYFFRLPKKIIKIIFYGHSLSKADFSYFYSIFDMYHLYDGDLSLYFLYSDYKNDKIENDNNHNKYVENIYNLINNYSNKSQNDSNLLHRLLLEGRIIIKKV